MSSLPSDLDEVVLRLGGLEITVRRAGAERAVDQEFELVEALEERSIGPQLSTEEEIERAYTPVELTALTLPGLVTLSRQLHSTDGSWTGAARVARAYRAGVSARKKVDRVCDYVVSSPPLPHLRNTYYIVLTCPRHPAGFWTSRSKTYSAGVRSPDGSSFDRLSVSHAFPSRAEVEAYLLGARQEWPQHLE